MNTPAKNRDRLVRAADALILQPSRFRSLALAVGNFGFGIALATLSFVGLPGGGILADLFPFLASIVAPIMLLCAVQSFVWFARKLPSLILHSKGVTTFLTGWWPITLADDQIASVVLHVAADGAPSLALTPVAAEPFRRSLRWLDRCYFDNSRRIVGYGLSLNVMLSPDEFAAFCEAFRERFGERFSSKAAGIDLSPATSAAA